MILYDLINTYM